MSASARRYRRELPTDVPPLSGRGSTSCTVSTMRAPRRCSRASRRSSQNGSIDHWTCTMSGSVCATAAPHRIISTGYRPALIVRRRGAQDANAGRRCKSRKNLLCTS